MSSKILAERLPLTNALKNINERKDTPVINHKTEPEPETLTSPVASAQFDVLYVLFTSEPGAPMCGVL